jgi:hypothetical protein
MCRILEKSTPGHCEQRLDETEVGGRETGPRPPARLTPAPISAGLGIGVSGGTGSRNEVCAKAGVAGLKQAVLGEMNPGPDPEIAVRPVRYVPRPMIASSSASGISL